MKKLLLTLIAVPMFMATAQNLQITKVTLDPAPQCPGGSLTNVSVTVVGGKAPYTFSSQYSNSTVGPAPSQVSGNTALFSFPTTTATGNPSVTIEVQDSSSPQLRTSANVRLIASLYTKATFTFLSPCAGKNNGAITITVAGTTTDSFQLDTTVVPANGASTYTFQNLAASSSPYTAIARSTQAAVCSNGPAGSTVLVETPLSEFENSFITNVSDYIVRAYCQQCFTRTAPTTTSVVSSCNSCDSCSSCNSCC